LVEPVKTGYPRVAEIERNRSGTGEVIGNENDRAISPSLFTA